MPVSRRRAQLKKLALMARNKRAENRNAAKLVSQETRNCEDDLGTHNQSPTATEMSGSRDRPRKTQRKTWVLSPKARLNMMKASLEDNALGNPGSAKKPCTRLPVQTESQEVGASDHVLVVRGAHVPESSSRGPTSCVRTSNLKTLKENLANRLKIGTAGKNKPSDLQNPADSNTLASLLNAALVSRSGVTATANVKEGRPVVVSSASSAPLPTSSGGLKPLISNMIPFTIVPRSSAVASPSTTPTVVRRLVKLRKVEQEPDTSSFVQLGDVRNNPTVRDLQMRVEKIEEVLKHHGLL